MSDYQVLIKRITQWHWWYRVSQAATWGIRGGLISTSITLIYALFQITQLQLLKSEWALWISTSALVGTSIAILIALFRPIPLNKAAIAFDRAFGLKERTSAAIELQSQTTATPDSWRLAQLNDALQATQNTKPTHKIPWKTPKIEIIGLVLLLAFIGYISFYGETQFQQAAQLAQQEQIIGEQIESLEELIQEIEKNENLSIAETEALISPLENAIEGLEEAEGLEETVSILNEAITEMEELATPDQASLENLKEAGASLLNQEGSPLEKFGEELAQGNLEQAAEALNDLDASQLSANEQAELAEQLSQLAEAVADTNPGLSSALQQAASDLQAGDSESAQENLQSASQSLTEQLESFEFSQAASETAQSLSQSQLEALQQASTASSASTGSESNDGNPGNSNDGNGSGDSGRGEFTEEVPQGSEAGLAPIEQDNGAGDGGETDYDSIYAPENLGGEDSGFSGQPASEAPGETKVGESNSDFEEGGTSNIPYTDVYNDYDSAVQSALESGIIPPALRPLIRDYFSSLAP